MRNISAEELKIILDKHLKWLKNEEGGEKADLSYTNLSYANLRHANLCRADIRYANLCHADLRYANLCNTNLSYTNLRYAELYYADLRWAKLYNTYLNDAVLSHADLRYADLRYADLCNTYLCDSKNIDETIWNIHTTFYPLQCPERGAYTAYKKASNFIVELLIPADAKRSSATSRKCRASKAQVISITHMDGSEYDGDSVQSDHDYNFVYRIGETVEVPNFDENRWNECAPGIHHFITREEAVKYYL